MSAQWLTMQQVASRTGLDASTVGKWAKRNAFGLTRTELRKGRYRLLIRAGAVQRFNHSRLGR